MIKIERNEKWKYPQVKINNKTMAEFDKLSGQWVYDKHIIILKSNVNSKDVKYKDDKGNEKTFKSVYFLGEMDNQSETISFTMGEFELKQLVNVKIGDMIQVEGGFYFTKTEQFKTKVVITKLN